MDNSAKGTNEMILYQRPQRTKTITQLQSKFTVDMREPVYSFLYYHNYIIGKGNKKVVLYNCNSRQMFTIDMQQLPFEIAIMPPYLFIVMQGQLLKLYGEQYSQFPLETIKISKLQPITMCNFNKGYFFGGYNKSSLPGNNRSTRRQVYYIEKLRTDKKNKPDYIIQIGKSTQPVSSIIVQNPYILIYCKPVFYLVSLFYRQTLITFEKQAHSIILLEGRFATSSLNGIGLSQNGSLFTFDIQRLPVYGVEVIEHLHSGDCICLERTGRVFGGRDNTIFEYFPLKKYSKCWTVYAENSKVLGIACTPANDLLILRLRDGKKYMIDIFQIQ